MKQPNLWAMRIALLCWFIRQGMGVKAALTLYHFAVGERSIIGWRRFLYNHRYLLSPWKSEYLRWRMLTVFRTSENITGTRFLAVMLLNKEKLIEWFEWHAKMKG